MSEACRLVSCTSRGVAIDLQPMTFPYVGDKHFLPFPFGHTPDEIPHCRN